MGKSLDFHDNREKKNLINKQKKVLLLCTEPLKGHHGDFFFFWNYFFFLAIRVNIKSIAKEHKSSSKKNPHPLMGLHNFVIYKTTIDPTDLVHIDFHFGISLQ